jgi:hypothetical protein
MDRLRRFCMATVFDRCPLLTAHRPRCEWTAEPHLGRYFELIDELGSPATARGH